MKQELEGNEKFLLKDKDRIIDMSDFDITYNKTKNGTAVFFMTFPDYEYCDAASKYIALALTKEKPRFFTLEFSEDLLNNQKCWIVGEFCIENNEKVHMNYETIDNMRLSWFSGYILGLLEESENKTKNSKEEI